MGLVKFARCEQGEFVYVLMDRGEHIEKVLRPIIEARDLELKARDDTGLEGSTEASRVDAIVNGVRRAPAAAAATTASAPPRSSAAQLPPTPRRRRFLRGVGAYASRTWRTVVGTVLVAVGVVGFIAGVATQDAATALSSTVLVGQGLVVYGCVRSTHGTNT